MPKHVNDGHYDVGRIEPGRDVRPRDAGTYGVIKGSEAERNGHLEWSHICEGALRRSKWFAYRIGPGDGGHGTRTDLLDVFDTKTEAVEYIQRRYGDRFDKKY